MNRKEYFKEYYRKNKEKLKEQMKVVYDEDRELQRSRCHKYRIEKSEDVNKYQNKYRKSNISIIRKRDNLRTKTPERRAYKLLRRKYGVSIPVSIIREIRGVR